MNLLDIENNPKSCPKTQKVSYEFCNSKIYFRHILLYSLKSVFIMPVRVVPEYIDQSNKLLTVAI